MYLATTREGAFAESLAPLIPDPDAVALLPPDDSIGAGFIDANWRATHRVCEVELANSAELPLLDFVDVPDAHNLALLDRALRPALALLDVSRLNISVVTSDRRSVTRLIAQYVASILDENSRRRYAGIRYISKHGINHECWAVFGNVTITRATQAEPLATDVDMRKIATRYGLNIH